MIKAIFTIAEEDLNDIAQDKIGRELTADEMRMAIKNFEWGIQWHEVAEIAVDLAVEEHKQN
jgi:hypothetical protein